MGLALREGRRVYNDAQRAWLSAVIARYPDQIARATERISGIAKAINLRHTRL
jgi:hypothetical protein